MQFSRDRLSPTIGLYSNDLGLLVIRPQSPGDTVIVSYVVFYSAVDGL